MGFEGANVLFDTLVHPLVMGLEEHLLTMFREDFEFHDEAGPSHHASHAPAAERRPQAAAEEGSTPSDAGLPENASGGEIVWLQDAEKELRKIPFFVRGKARRNTEAFASTQGLATISVETLYDAKAHYSR
jgi:light-independent protochlorophyllide reductase subunit B